MSARWLSSKRLEGVGTEKRAHTLISYTTGGETKEPSIFPLYITLFSYRNLHGNRKFDPNRVVDSYADSLLKRFETFRNCSLFCTFWLLLNFYLGDSHHANYGKHSLNHHFEHCKHSVYQIYSVLKLFEIAVYFAHFGFYEISTLVMCIMLTMAHIV